MVSLIHLSAIAAHRTVARAFPADDLPGQGGCVLPRFFAVSRNRNGESRP